MLLWKMMAVYPVNHKKPTNTLWTNFTLLNTKSGELYLNVSYFGVLQ
jgi:hypothetical protein